MVKNKAISKATAELSFMATKTFENLSTVMTCRPLGFRLTKLYHIFGDTFQLSNF